MLEQMKATLSKQYAVRGEIATPPFMNIWEEMELDIRVKRINKFRLRLNRGQEEVLRNLCTMSAVLWNKLNYVRRQAFFKNKFDWSSGVDELYNDFKKILGSAIAQEVIRKNDEAWRSFFKLKGMKKLPATVRKISPPGYWKDRLTGKKRLMTVIRCDSYKIVEENGRRYLVILPRKLGLKIWVTGSFRWIGKQGRLEIFYDDLSGKWYGHQSVTVEIQPRHTASPRKCFVDLGVVNLITAWIEGDVEPIAFSGRPLLADWYYWSNRISFYQSLAKKLNGKYTTRRIRKLYRKRKRRFRDRVNKIVKKFIDICCEKNVSEIVVGDLNGLRYSYRSNGSRKKNKLINNFWSYRYIVNRLKTTAENNGIMLRFIDEKGTSTICPICRMKGKRIYRGLFYCKNCGYMNADVVGALNIAKKCDVKISKEIKLHPKFIKVKEIIIPKG